MRDRIVLRILVVGAIAISLGVIPVVPALALTGTEMQITTNTADQLDPAISGSYIVYTGASYWGGDWSKDIFLYDIPSGREYNLTPGTPNDQYLDDVDGNRIVYTSVTFSGSDIHLYDVETGITTLLSSGGNNYLPAVEGDHVVFVNATATARNIMLVDVAAWTVKTISHDPPDAYAARVDGDWVVWEEVVGSWRQIKAYWISAGKIQTLTTDEANHCRPDISGNLVVWADDRNGNWDIYGYDLDTGVTTQLTFDPSDQQYPRVSGRRVVWEDGRGDVTQIWTMDLDEGLEEPVSPSSHAQFLNAIDGDRIVWTESRYGNFDIFMFTENRAPELTIGPQEINEGDTLSIFVTATDPDGDILFYSAENLPEGAVFDIKRMFTWTPGYDQAGVYTVTFWVTDGDLSDTEEVTITVHNVNRIPVADAGPDQLLHVIGQQVILCGDQSYDEDGEILIPQWTLVSRPVGSTAYLEDATSFCTNFIADVQGTYIGQLVVRDPYSESLPDYVIVSFENIPPVADAGNSQSILLGDTVLLDGGGSYDLNGDILAYTWSLTTAPPESVSQIVNPYSVYTSITPDTIGTYTIQLVVNDGIVDSDPSSIQVEVVDRETNIIEDLQALQNAINALDPSVFKNPNMPNALINKINAIISDVNNGDYQDALLKLQHDILPKTDGCALYGAPDNNDWIRDCEAQGIIYPMVLSIIEEL